MEQFGERRPLLRAVRQPVNQDHRPPGLLSVQEASRETDGFTVSSSRALSWSRRSRAAEYSVAGSGRDSRPRAFARLIHLSPKMAAMLARAAAIDPYQTNVPRRRACSAEMRYRHIYSRAPRVMSRLSCPVRSQGDQTSRKRRSRAGRPSVCATCATTNTAPPSSWYDAPSPRPTV